LRIHLQRAALSGVVDPLLEVEPLPRCTAILWQVFLELNATRSSGMGANPLSLLEIDAWCRLSAVQLTAWEFAAIKAIDSAVLSEWSKSKKTETKA
jgi:hypothetical protein